MSKEYFLSCFMRLKVNGRPNQAKALQEQNKEIRESTDQYSSE